MAMPLFSVIIATYHWPAALALAIRSVLAQTCPDFELLVVGDGCTDETVAVVRGFGDPRIRWFNLPENTGSQWRPNNVGLEESRGEYVAYLGHDDLWHPEHLLVAADLIAAARPAAIAAGTVLHGPGGTAIRALSGFFAGGRYSPTQVIVPSGLLHRRDVVAAVGPWRDHRELREPVDVEFVRRLARTVGDVAPTRRLTVFKWPSAWRRDSYRIRDVSAQAAAVAQLTGDRLGREAFVQRELHELLQSAVDGTFFPTEITDERLSAEPGGWILPLLAVRGLRHRPVTARLGELTAPLRVTPPFSEAAFEWHGPEDSPSGRFAWSGPGRESGIEIPVQLDTPAEIVIAGMGTLEPEAWESIVVTVGGRSVPLSRSLEGPLRMLRGRLAPADQPDPGRPLVVTLSVPAVARPYDRGINEDRRWLGAAVNYVELRPAVETTT
jgi:hypothetical protein